EADMIVASVCGPLGDNAIVAAEEAGLSPAAAEVGVTVLVEVEPEDKEHFREVYLGKIRPFLDSPDSKTSELANPRMSESIFTGLRRLLPSTVHSVVDDLENICEEERQLHRQRGMYRMLHGWLLVHVPLSIALLVLGGIHAIVALRY